MILGLKWDLDTMELLDHINSFLRIKPNKKINIFMMIKYKN